MQGLLHRAEGTRAWQVYLDGALQGCEAVCLNFLFSAVGIQFARYSYVGSLTLGCFSVPVLAMDVRQ